MTSARRRLFPWLALLAVLAVVGAACGSGGDAAEETTTAIAPTTAAEAGDGGGEETPTTTEAGGDPLLEAAMALSWRVGITGEGVFRRDGSIRGFQLNKLPAALAIESLNAEGWDIAPIFLNQSEAPVQALIQGSVDVANSSVAPVITAAAAGADIKSFAKTRSVEYVMLARTGIDGPEDLDGVRVGIHSETSTDALLTLLYLKDYPEVEPIYLIVPGSGNRIQAMLAGELDATPAQFGDDTTAMEAAPGQFSVIFDFSSEMPDLVDSVLSYNPSQMDDELRVFLEYLLAKTVEFQRMVYEDPDWALQQAETHEVAETSGLDRYIESQVFPTDIGLSVEALDFTIQGLIDANRIEVEDVPAGSDIYDGSIWEGAQALLDS